MSKYTGSYLGFTFDGIHSSELGLTRVSDGSRYEENFLADFQDKTAQAVGADNTYYYGSYYTKKNFSISVAFDSLTDVQIRTMKQMFGDKNLHKLVFDELPYKYYWVKCSSSPNFKVLAFDVFNERMSSLDNKADLYGAITSNFYQGPAKDSSNGRVFKGEGRLNFVAYDPLAHSVYKYIDNYNIYTMPGWNDFLYYNTSQPNLTEWMDSVHLVQSTRTETINNVDYTIDTPQDGKVLFYNPGDFATPFKLKFMYNGSSGTKTVPAMTVSYDTDAIAIKSFTLDAEDFGFQINSKLHLLEGLNEDGELSGKVYNKYILEGDFFNLPKTDTCQLLTYQSGNLSNYDVSIEYDYLYY